ncbi:MAG: sulfoxide reductase heme-binding subunit YedZ [Acidobacteriia bacterium]|nr:sulfoxide reductase heme-binding subunit YedZ [Terriglobia bacterium]
MSRGLRVRAFLFGKWAKAAVFLAGLLPLAALLWRALHHGLTANPIEFITHATGDWTLRFLLLTLAVTPLRTALRLPELIRFRRLLGLFAFFYACLHFSTYIGLDKFFDLAEMAKDVAKRRFITVGFAAFLLLLPLAVTSTAGWIRRLGGRRWQLLHRAIYFSALAGVIHYYWLVKSAVLRPLAYGLVLGLLLLWRFAEWSVRSRRTLAPGKSFQ